MRTPVVLVCLLLSAAVSAQTPIAGTERVAWCQGATTLADAQGYQYAIYIDGTKRLVTAICVASAAPCQATDFPCEAPVPAMTPGQHELAATAAELVNGVAIESLRSTSIQVLMKIAPSAPSSFRIISGG